MAENKKSFLLYCDLIHTVEMLSNEKAGELFNHILKYVNDENPVSDDMEIKLAFMPIKQALKRDLVKYEGIVERNRVNGSKGGRPRTQSEPKKPNGLNGNPTKPKKADSDSDSDSDSVIDNDSVKETIKTWKTDYQIYLSESRIAYQELLQDKEFIKKLSHAFPSMNIKKSIENSFVLYWSTDDGWKRKIKAKGNLINWKTTIQNSIKINAVYNQKSDVENTQVQQKSEIYPSLSK